ncbi:anti-phage-associated DUF3780 domain-containing protein [Rubrivivax benzoatilyticus]|uniref:DUF3780 domain-containing protein n=1 Tax=Rubrivivax benzoatilyticus TaxID=316997 RepID=A0ABX0HWF1_9BURK|nr:anti-phage-associated DUF3780 domain-containing protein [Rubrivivax benzoatilyticus]EGJ12179.1 hypothetical protein RBXJA2T_17696 [Rubrivivax benzoatilyticus JA2 = ATCC BAA-35]NHK99322.1 DUF3780 domain-containing protein [Rubrivivax benzoatilyticus]NHL25196.1 DUF3780 domain-containing protein [Rubrivivax benzoatilyticus]
MTKARITRAAAAPDANAAAPAAADVRPTLGFGVPATSDPHHFKVIVPRSNTAPVQVSEYLGLQALSSEHSVIDRCVLDRARWTAIRAEVQRAFNARLSAHDLRPGAWKTGDNPVDRLLGRELCVLVWAVEQMEMEKIPVAVRNWLALRPEERWWLFGMTAMSTGGIGDGCKGWRLALRHALGDVAQSELLSPRSRRGAAASASGIAGERPTLDLFGDGTA